MFDHVAKFFPVITLLALLGALVLLSSTMSTLVGEQTQEIATMKAIGAGRAQIRSVYLRTTVLLGALGAIVGAVLGTVIAYAMTSVLRLVVLRDQCPVQCGRPRARGEHRGGRDRAAAGRAARNPPRHTAPASGDTPSERERPRAHGRLDRLLRRARFLPRTAQIGLRGVTRRSRRSAATILQIGLAVATMLALLALGPA